MTPIARIQAYKGLDFQMQDLKNANYFTFEDEILRRFKLQRFPSFAVFQFYLCFNEFCKTLE